MTLADPRLRAALIPASVLSSVAAAAERRGLDSRPWLARAGLAELSLTAPDTRVSFRQAADFLRCAVRAMPGVPLGIEVGRRDVFLSFGMLGLAMRSSATLGEALDLGLELHQTTGSLMDVAKEEFDGETALRVYERAPEPDILPFLCEELFCSVLLAARFMLEEESVPHYLQLAYPAPSYAAEYAEFFRCQVRFGAGANRLVFSDATLRRPLPRWDPANQAVAVAACRSLLRSDEAPHDIVAVVEAVLRENLRRPMTMAAIANRLHVAERTLHRRLAAAGERFSGLRDRVRCQRARSLVRETRKAINEIAAEVGFSDTREFRRAYLRWTGLTPSTDRATGTRDGASLLLQHGVDLEQQRSRGQSVLAQ
ncbi:MAG: AraC family transcriptional regulator ligand-binding domain-containing protein [Segniliparus sp.]|uniref:AraC family transcriptional regulator ligand-binding domain-containing protein n=1 Tax=Segniliparus sp. TaxID=2804064 RepID=UPI003F36FD15